MKSFRQLLRRRQNHARTAPKRRRLSTQALEQRQMLAGDFNEAHNYWNNYDVNQDLQLSPSDALSVINFLASEGSSPAGELGSEESFTNRKVDVNGDGNVTPSDALSVINALSRGEGVGELVALRLTARDDNDVILTETNGITQVGEGIENSFFLEVAYDDLRGFSATGVFSIFPDVTTSRGGLLQPVLRESQQVIFGEELFSSASGDFSIALEGDESNTVVVTLQEFGAGPTAPINTFTNALISLGYDATDFQITRPSFLNDDAVGLQIRYIGDDLGNVDVPDLVVTPNFNNNVPVTFNETSPFLEDGVSPNDAALPLSLDVRSRSANQAEVYNSLNRGTFDSADGFTDVGGVGPIDGVVFPGGSFDIDAFAIEVFVTGPISDNAPLIVDVNPGSGTDPMLLYGSDDPVPDEMILINENSLIRLSTGAMDVNNDPTLEFKPLVENTNEDADDVSFDLLRGATDVDGDTLNVTDFTLSGDTAGVAQNGNSLDVTPASYNSLAVGETATVVAEYNVNDGNGGIVDQTLTLTIDGLNDAPDAGPDLMFTNDEFDAAFNIALLDGATDPDTNDTLDVTAIVQVGSDDNSGVVADVANNQIVVTPSAYAALNDGESVTVTYDFTVSDGNGGEDTARVVVTINGDTPNTPPVAGDPIVRMENEDEGEFTIDLTTNVTDVDPEDTLTVVDSSVVINGDTSGISRDGNILTVTPNAYNSLAEGSSTVIELTYDVSDGEGGSDSHSATITITGLNDAPVVTGPVLVSLTEDESSTGVDLLAGASDPDVGDTVSVTDLTYVSGDDQGFTVDADSITVDPTAYNFLAVGESVDVVYTYNVVDTNEASTPQTATITITGLNDAPTVGEPVLGMFTEDDNAPATVNLLEGAADPDTNDSLSISNFMTVSGNSTPFTIVNDESISFDPNSYNSLADGESEVVVVSYDVVDGNGGSASQTATITITGENDAPVISDPISQTASEQDADFVVSLLENASDPDTSDILNVEGVMISGDDQSGVNLNGNNLEVSPSAYDSLAAGQSAVITLTYQVTDGIASVNQTATITINGADDAPVVEGPLEFTFDERDQPTTVSLLTGASDPNNDPLNVINAEITSGDSSGVFVNLSNSTLEINPRAYEDLEDGEQEVIVVEYDITDNEDNVVSQTATVTITGRTFVGSSVSGTLFIDHIENLEDVRNGADPIRNGIREDDEDALGGVIVRLYQVAEDGTETPVLMTMTDNEGNYTFPEVVGGTYVVEYDVPDSVMFEGSNRGMMTVSEEGGETLQGPSLGGIGLVGVQQRIELLARYYAQISSITDDPEGLGTAQLNADGDQLMFIAGDGFDSEFAEVVLNDTRDSVLLTLRDENGDYQTARIGQEFFVVAGDGEGVRFFGSLEDYGFAPFNPNDVALREEFDDYGDTINMILGLGL